MISASYGLVVRVEIPNRPRALTNVLQAIGTEGGSLGAIDIVRATEETMVRDITVNATGTEHAERIVGAVEAVTDCVVLDVSDRTFLLHSGGKIEVTAKTAIRTRDDLSMAYTPGVARVSEALAIAPDKAFSLTVKANMVAVVTDGSAVLGLGNIGAEAAMPVMEGKAVLFKQFAGVDAFPICIRSQDVDDIVACVVNIAPSFGGINLEDVSAPRCFEIEERLRRELDIPVFHDDQHGTAVVVLAALLNASTVVRRAMSEMKVVVNGIGAAGVACVRMLLNAGIAELIGLDSQGILYEGREGLNSSKQWVAENTNPRRKRGRLAEALEGADVFLGLSSAGTLSADLLRRMAPEPIVFAMANPVPEIMPEEARDKVRVMATGRSDYANQINNVLCFPGFFRGLLDCRATDVNEQMKLAAAKAMAAVIPENQLHEDYIIPSVFDKAVAPSVASAVSESAVATGVGIYKD